MTKKFRYTEPFANYFLFCHAVDDHNNLQHSLPSIEGTWVTHCWPVRVFSFLLAISEINTYLALKYFVWSIDEQRQLHDFRRRLAFNLIDNDYINGETIVGVKTRNKKRDNIHTLQVAPKFATRWMNGAWKCEAKSRYQQYICKTIGCKRQVQTYCSCAPGQWLCSTCHVNHVVEAVSADAESI